VGRPSESLDVVWSGRESILSICSDHTRNGDHSLSASFVPELRENLQSRPTTVGPCDKELARCGFDLSLIRGGLLLDE
jgi:hypothetical protein